MTPLMGGSGKEVISKNISEMMHANKMKSFGKKRSKDQIIRIAMEKARMSGMKK